MVSLETLLDIGSFFDGIALDALAERCLARILRDAALCVDLADVPSLGRPEEITLEAWRTFWRENCVEAGQRNRRPFHALGEGPLRPVAVEDLDALLVLRHQHVGSQRRHAAVVRELRPAVVRLGAAEEHLDDHRRVGHDVGLPRDGLDRAADHHRVGVGRESRRHDAELQVGGEHPARPRAHQPAQYRSDAHRELSVRWGPSCHRPGLAVEILVLLARACLQVEVLVVAELHTSKGRHIRPGTLHNAPLSRRDGLERVGLPSDRPEAHMAPDGLDG